MLGLTRRFIVTLICVLVCFLGATTQAQAAESDAPRKVYVGAYAFQIPELNLAQSTYLVDFWVWFRWQGNDIDPSKTFELINLYEGWNILKTPIYVDENGVARPEHLGDDWYYQCLRIHARFSRVFDVRAYPFDEQQLTIAFEDNDSPVSKLIYVPDKDTSRVDPSLGLSGWFIDHISAGVTEREYPTNWGDPRRAIGDDRYSKFYYTIHIKRPISSYLATTLLPIAIVMLITMVVYFVDPRYFEGRLGLAITALLSAVALQLTTQRDLPPTGYRILLDDVHLLSYVTILLALAESAYSVQVADRGDPKAAKRLDRIGLIASVVLFFGGTAVMVLVRAA